jgi:hypothetical protein
VPGGQHQIVDARPPHADAAVLDVPPSVRDPDAVFADATAALFSDASALMRRARGMRQELEQARATGADEAERLTHGAIAAGIEGGLVQGLEADLAGRPRRHCLRRTARRSVRFRGARRRWPLRIVTPPANRQDSAA